MGPRLERYSQRLGSVQMYISLWESDHDASILEGFSDRSAQLRDEAQEGYDRGILIPVRIDDIKLPLGFRRSQTADLFGWPTSGGDPPATSGFD